MTLENILEMWKKDSIIDEHNLDDASRDAAKLHGKYLELLTISKLQLKKAEADLDDILKDKWLYYNGKMDKKSIDERGWAYDPFDGLSKPLKGDLEYYYNTDYDIKKQKGKIDYLKTQVGTLEEIINTLRWRHQTVRNMIDWRRFVSGG